MAFVRKKRVHTSQTTVSVQRRHLENMGVHRTDAAGDDGSQRTSRLVAGRKRRAAGAVSAPAVMNSFPLCYAVVLLFTSTLGVRGQSNAEVKPSTRVHDAPAAQFISPPSLGDRRRAAAIPGENCDAGRPSFIKCRAYTDTVLLVQSTSGSYLQHDALSTLMIEFVNAYEFNASSAGTPRIGLITYSTQTNQLQTLTANRAALLDAIVTRPPSQETGNLPGALDTALGWFNSGARAGVDKRVVIVVGTLALGGHLWQEKIDNLKAAGVRVSVWQFAQSQVALGAELARNMSSVPRHVFLKGSDTTSVSDLTAAVFSMVEAGCTSIDYVCRDSSTCEFSSNLYVHGGGFFLNDANSASDIRCRAHDGSSYRSATVSRTDAETLTCTFTGAMENAAVEVSADTGKTWTYPFNRHIPCLSPPPSPPPPSPPPPSPPPPRPPPPSPPPPSPPPPPPPPPPSPS